MGAANVSAYLSSFCRLCFAAGGRSRACQFHSVLSDEPFGGLPTLAYARLFERARDEGVTVLLDGQGMDEQWAGYDYYGRAGAGPVPLMQGARERAVRPECLVPEFRALSVPLEVREAFPDRLRNLQ